MEDISVQELKKRLDQGEKIFLVDVREPYEHEEFNIGGELAPLQSALPVKISEWRDRNQEEIIVYCRSGNRSNMAKMLMTQAGYTNVRNLLGGMIAWRDSFSS